MLKKSGENLQELTRQTETGLQLLDMDTADEIISEPTDEYNTLIQATSSAMAMLWAMMKSNGLHQTKETLQMGAQAMQIIVTLVHYAYALGVRHGREED
jgi:hypothetical protein